MGKQDTELQWKTFIEYINTYISNPRKELLIKMYEYATKEKFSPLIIDLEESSEKRFRKGFLEILNPDEFS